MIRLFTAKALPVITLKPSRLKQLSMEVKCVRSIPSKPLARGWSVLGATLQGLQPWSPTIYRSSENHLWKSRHGKSAEDEWWKNEKAKRAYFTFAFITIYICLACIPLHLRIFTPSHQFHVHRVRGSSPQTWIPTQTLSIIWEYIMLHLHFSYKMMFFLFLVTKTICTMSNIYKLIWK
jgi:hypothetical protein